MPRETDDELIFEVVKAINVNSFEKTLASTIVKHEFEGYKVTYDYKPAITSKDQIMHIALVEARLQ